MIPLRKRFMFKEAFNVEMLRAVELGLVQKWFKDAAYHERKIYGYRENNMYSSRPLGLHELYPVFIMWALGVCLSILAFVCELLLNKFFAVKLPYLE